MSNQMKADKNCSQHKLSLRTYKVIPLNVHCGIISWIENTSTIDSFLSEDDKRFDEINMRLRGKYDHFLDKGHKHKKLTKNVSAALHYSPDEVNLETKLKFQNCK